MTMVSTTNAYNHTPNTTDLDVSALRDCDRVREQIAVRTSAHHLLLFGHECPKDLVQVQAFCKDLQGLLRLFLSQTPQGKQRAKRWVFNSRSFLFERASAAKLET